MKKKYTIEDVAKHAGVSVSTVSRVLNNSTHVSAEKRKRVAAQIKRMEFTPNAMARGLVRKNNQSICVILPEISNPFYSIVLQGIESVARQKDYSVMLYAADWRSDTLDIHFRKILEWRASGLIFVAVSVPPERIPKGVRNMEIVSIQADIDNVCRVDSTNRKGAREAVEHLIALGHKRIAFIGYEFGLKCLNERYRGYEAALKAHGLEINSDYIVECDEFDNPGYYCVKKLLQLKRPPTAIHCINEKVAIGAYEALLEHDLTIPDDISLSAHDNSPIAKILTPKGLTTVAQPAFEMGVAAAEQIIRNIESPKAIPCEEIILGTKLILRGSTTGI